MPKHKHYDVIVAWASGEEIEWSADGKNWYHRDAGDRRAHEWFESLYYRVEPKIPMYRLYYHKAEADVVNVVLKDFSDYETFNWNSLKTNNIVWLTDWLPLPERKEECPTK